MRPRRGGLKRSPQHPERMENVKRKAKKVKGKRNRVRTTELDSRTALYSRLLTTSGRLRASQTALNPRSVLQDRRGLLAKPESACTSILTAGELSRPGSPAPCPLQSVDLRLARFVLEFFRRSAYSQNICSREASRRPACRRASNQLRVAVLRRSRSHMSIRLSWVLPLPVVAADELAGYR